MKNPIYKKFQDIKNFKISKIKHIKNLYVKNTHKAANILSKNINNNHKNKWQNIKIVLNYI